MMFDSRLRLSATSKGLFDTPYRLFLAALIVAQKYLDDCPFKNSVWVKVNKMFALHDGIYSPYTS